MKSSRKRRRLAKWTVGVLCAGFFAYLLSLGPLAAMQRHGFLQQLAPAVELYECPANWLARIRPLHRLMEWYVARWLDLTDAPDTTI